MPKFLIKNGSIINRGEIRVADILIEDDLISKIGVGLTDPNARIIDAQDLWVFPGCIDDQVHFREPGLTHKADIYSESRAAVAGGITSYMEMPNTVPNAVTQELLAEKYEMANRTSLANYSFYMGTTNDNLDEILRTNPRNVCGVKIFMGASTGNMLVDDVASLESIFSRSPVLIATHCEDEATIRENSARYREQYGDDLPIRMHPLIRSEEACYLSSSLAVSLAKKYGTRLHILHISTARELELFTNAVPLNEKRITAEACIHHLWFSEKDYDTLGTFIKWNPAIKTVNDRDAIRKALKDGFIDVVATDHAPHTKKEKSGSYFNAPSGGPLVQHSLVAMLELFHNGLFGLTEIAEKMAHNPATLFQVEKRGFIEEGYYADLVLVSPHSPWQVEKKNLLYKCGWSPFEGVTFKSSVKGTFVSGHPAFLDGKFDESRMGERLLFNR